MDYRTMIDLLAGNDRLLGALIVLAGFGVVALLLFWLVFPITVWQQMKRQHRLLEQIEWNTRPASAPKTSLPRAE